MHNNGTRGKKAKLRHRWRSPETRPAREMCGAAAVNLRVLLADQLEAVGRSWHSDEGARYQVEPCPPNMSTRDRGKENRKWPLR